MSPIVEMRFQLAYSVVMQATWGMSYANVDRDADGNIPSPTNAFRVGNPFLAFPLPGQEGAVLVPRGGRRDGCPLPAFPMRSTIG